MNTQKNSTPPPLDEDAHDQRIAERKEQALRDWTNIKDEPEEEQPEPYFDQRFDIWRD